MENNVKSKITVVGFIVFVLLVYTGSYFYTKDNNQRLLSSPRLVLLIGDEEQINNEFSNMPAEERQENMRSLYESGVVFSVSQQQYDDGLTNIADFYLDEIKDNDFVVADCMDYSETLKKTMEKAAKTKLKEAWVFSACGIIE